MLPASLDCPFFFIAPTVFYEMATCNLKMFLVDRTQNSASYNDHLSSPQFVLVVSVLLIALTFYIVLLCVIRFLVPCCDVRYDFHIKNDVWFAFHSSCLYEGSFPIYVICVCLCILVSKAYCLTFVFVCLRLVYTML